MASIWDEATLSTSTTISVFESEVNNLSQTNWDTKITIAKTIIGNRLLEQIETLDDVENPAVFNIASDYLILHLIFEDITKASMKELAKSKSKFYWGKYESEMIGSLKRMNLSSNETVRIISGRLTR